MEKPSRPRFAPGAIVATRGVADTVGMDELQGLLARHLRGDWGQLDQEDIAANERALIEGTRLLSAYVLRGGQKIWIITEADRSATTFLYPEEY